MTEFLTALSFGEAADRISILQIKRDRIREPERRANVEMQLAQASTGFFERAACVPAFSEMFGRLKAINERLWDIEDEIRGHEDRQDFGPEFVELARSVYLTNDKRSRLKRELDVLFGCPVMEEKSYICYLPRSK